MTYIRGAGSGGKGGGGHTPVEADDSLQSVQFATVLDLLSEGEIQGLDTGDERSIYLNKTPVKSEDQDGNITDNFGSYKVVTRNGSLNQFFINELSTSGTPGNPTNVSYKVTNTADPLQEDQSAYQTARIAGSKVVQLQVADNTTDSVRIIITAEILRVIEDDGDIVGNEVMLDIETQHRDGNGTASGYTSIFVQKGANAEADERKYNNGYWDKIKGKTSSIYQKDYLFNIPSGANFPIDIRVSRVSQNEDSSRRSSDIKFSSYTKIINDKLAYPYSALAYLRFDSREFSSIPTRKYKIRGIKVKVPSNAKVDISETKRLVLSTGQQETITNGVGYPGRISEYVSVWDGTFSAVTWCNDPAWCLYDLLISERYGVGIPEDTLDKWEFYKISQYCNELVDDGQPGTGFEPRFSCNLLINGRTEVYNAIKEMAAIFRGMSFYGAGTLSMLQDSPADSQYLLGPSNVIDGRFDYAGTSQKARHTTALVAFQSYDNLGDVQFERVEDVDAIIKYGIIEKEIKALGCYSQGQAHRLGLWALKSEQLLTESCTFGVSIESGIILRPGMVIDIADPVKAFTRRQGRIRSGSTTSVINIDSGENTSIDLTKDPKISVLLPTGVMETENIGSVNTQNRTVSLATGKTFSEAPAEGSVFSISTTDVPAFTYRVISVSEATDGGYAVAAIKYEASIYAGVDAGEEITVQKISNLSTIPGLCTGIIDKEFLYSDGQGVFIGCDISWRCDPKAVAGYKVTYRVNQDNWATVETASPSISLRQGGNFGALRAGYLQIQLQAVNYLGQSGPLAVHNVTLRGKTQAPASVKNLTMVPTNGLARLQWTQSTDLDVVVGGLVRIRHSAALAGVTWATASAIHDDVTGTAKEAYCDLKEGTYLAKFIDSGGRPSITASKVEFTKPDLDNLHNVTNQTEDSSFNGAKVDAIVESGELLNSPDQAPLTNNTYDSLYMVDHTSDYVIITSNPLTGGGNIGHSYVANNYINVTASGSNSFPSGSYKVHSIVSVLGCGDAIQFEYAPSFTNGFVNIKPAYWKTSSNYLFNNNPIDLGGIFNVQLDSSLKLRGIYPAAARIDSLGEDYDSSNPLTTGFDTVLEIDGVTPSTTDALLSIRTTQAASPYPSNWGAGTSYSLNDLRRATTDQENYIFKCVVAGTSGSSEPTWPNPEVWSASKAIALGTKVKASTNNSSFIFECTVAGTTGATEPTWPTSENGTVIDQNPIGDHVTWKAVYAVTDNAVKWVPIYPDEWTSWRPFNNAQFSARKYELKLAMTTGGDRLARIAIEELRAAENMVIRTINGSGTTVGGADKEIIFPNKFKGIPVIGITFTANTGSGDYYQITSTQGGAEGDAANDRFFISIRNSSDQRQARTFNWTATGYGKG